MRLYQQFACLPVALVSLAMMNIVATAVAGDARLELPRHAYYRGEAIPLTVSLAEEVKDASIEVELGGHCVAMGRLTGRSAKIAVPTASIRCGRYTLRAVIHSTGKESAGSEKVTLARRPAADRLEIWRWGTGGTDNSFYFDHGFTISGGPSWTYWRENSRLGAIQALDSCLARGVYATIGPLSGISRRDLKGVPADAADVAYRGAGRREDRFYNPFAPEVERVRQANNRRFLASLGDHPAIKVAFYNTELVDNLWLDNLNRQGVELTRQRLGFTRDQRGEPQFVAPGVLADDDRGYRFQRYVFKEGNGLAYANQKTADDVHQYRPDVLTLTDPYRQVALLGLFPGMDLIGTWTYTNNDPKLMLYVETMRALTRGTRRLPLETVTLLNYPGALAPRSLSSDPPTRQWHVDNPAHAGWMLMGPDRCKEVSWIILSRAPKFLGYYYGSPCNPLKYNRPEDQFRVPHATSDAILEMSRRVYQPYGPMITRLAVARRRIAVLSSQASRLYGKSPRATGYPNEQIDGFYSVLAMAHLDGDVIFDEHVEQGCLKDYDVLVLPRCDVVTKTVYDEILHMARRGGTIVADQYLGPSIPGAIRVACDFSCRPKVNAEAIANGLMYAAWDDHLNPNTAALAKASGVTAEDDQKILESYARRLTAALEGKVTPEVDLDTPKALVNLLEKNGAKYLVLVNDRRTYDDRTGRYKAIQEKLLPQTVTATLRHWTGPLYAYDLLERKPLPVTRAAGGIRFPVHLTELGGTIIALYPMPLSRVVISPLEAAKRGSEQVITVSVEDHRGEDVQGLQPLRVVVTDPKNGETEYTGYYCAENGCLRIPFLPAVNDSPGKWRVTAEDLTAGIRATGGFEVR